MKKQNFKIFVSAIYIVCLNMIEFQSLHLVHPTYLRVDVVLRVEFIDYFS